MTVDDEKVGAVFADILVLVERHLHPVMAIGVGALADELGVV